MEGLLKGGTKVLSTTYGSNLQALGSKIGVLDLQDSLNIVQGGIYRQATFDIARGSLKSGADVLATNSFGARTLLRMGDIKLYREVMEAQFQVTLDALRTEINKYLIVALGPYAVGNPGCYDIGEAPYDSHLAAEFHAEQFAIIRELAKKGLISAVVVETISTAREARGVVSAAQKMNLSVPVIPSFFVGIDGKLKTGEELAAVIEDIDGATNSFASGFSANCCPLEGAEKAMSHSNGQRHRIVMAYPNASDADPSGLEEVNGAVCVRDHHTTAAMLVQMAARNKSLKIIGGCCGFEPESVDVFSAARDKNFSDV